MTSGAERQPAWETLGSLACRASGLALALALSPLAALVAVVVRLRLGRPVLFVQERAGLHGKPFQIVKFRTMRPEAYPGENDASRLSRTGVVLRAASLDELPALWNVVRGDMSLVGPRPLPTAYTKLYNDAQRVRLNVLPGITGLAQIRGRNRLTWEKKFELDRWYVEHKSILLDLRILLETPLAVLRTSETVHEGHTTMPRFEGSASGPRS